MPRFLPLIGLALGFSGSMADSPELHDAPKRWGLAIVDVETTGLSGAKWNLQLYRAMLDAGLGPADPTAAMP